MELKKYRLDELAKVEISGVDKKTKDNETPVKLCNFTDVYYNWAITKDMADSFMEASANQKEIDSFTLKKGQVAFTKDSETRYDIGVPTYIADDFENVVLGYHTALVTPDKNKLSGKYLNAFMNSKYIQKYFENNASGSGQRYTLSNETLNSIPVLAPDLPTQDKIGNIFSNIDRKIELNRRMNAKLEQMAKRLYDHWFVQFDFPNAEGKPYKSSNGKMVWNEKLKREIPDGWEVITLGEVCDIYNGSTPSTKEVDNYGGNIIWITPKDLSEQKSKFVYQGARNITKKGYDSCSTTFVPKGTIVMSSRAPIGLISIASCKLCTNQGFKNLVPKNMDYSNLLYYTLKAHISLIQNIGTGTTFKEVSKEELSKFKVLYPSKTFITAFNEKTKSIFNYQLEIEKENAKLTKLRDRLLPLLMNGQVEVK